MTPFEHLIWLVTRGFFNTVALLTLSLPPAVCLGFALGLARAYTRSLFSRLLDAVADVLRGFPLLALIFAFVYGLRELGLTLNAFTASAVAVAMCSSAYISEYVKTGVLASIAGEILAARSLGMSKLQEIRYVVLPRLLRRMTPVITNEAIYVIQISTLAGLVGVYELLSAARTYVSLYFDTWTPLITVTIVYLALALLLDKIFRFLTPKDNT